MANSIPKGGTNLLVRLLGLLGFPESRFWIGADLIHNRSEADRLLLRGDRAGDRVWIGSEAPVQISGAWLRTQIRNVPDGFVFGAHCLYTTKMDSLLQELRVRTVCILRDPRAIAASHMDHICRSPDHFFHAAYMALPDVWTLRVLSRFSLSCSAPVARSALARLTAGEPS